MGFSTPGVPFAAKGLPVDRPGFWKGFARDLWDPAVVYIFGIFVLANVLATNYFVDSVSRLLRHFVGI